MSIVSTVSAVSTVFLVSYVLTVVTWVIHVFLESHSLNPRIWQPFHTFVVSPTVATRGCYTTRNQKRFWRTFYKIQNCDRTAVKPSACILNIVKFVFLSVWIKNYQARNAPCGLVSHPHYVANGKNFQDASASVIGFKDSVNIATKIKQISDELYLWSALSLLFPSTIIMVITGQTKECSLDRVQPEDNNSIHSKHIVMIWLSFGPNCGELEDPSRIKIQGYLLLGKKYFVFQQKIRC